MKQDKSRIEADWECQRLGYWSYEHDGGIEPIVTPADLLIGRLGHEALAHLARREPVVIPTGHGAMPEHTAILQGLVAVYAARVWPRWMQDFEVVSVEETLRYEHQGITWATKPDLLLRSRADGSLWWLEYKFFWPTWGTFGAQHEYSAQLQLGAWVAEQARLEPVAGCYVQGLSLGAHYKGRTTSRMAYAYRKPAIPLVSPETWRVDQAKGFTWTPIVEYDGGYEGWAHSTALTNEVVADTFPQSLPIFKRDRLVAALIRQRVARMKVVEAWREGKLTIDEAFGQTFRACRGTRGRTCAMLEACWGPSGVDPCDTGAFRSKGEGR